jgi:MoxR-like ATPase
VEWERVVALRSVISDQVELSEYLEEYITRLVRASRSLESQKTQRLEDKQRSSSALVEEFVILGASPRATMCWGASAKVRSLIIDERHEVYPEDIQDLARNILSHRIVLRTTARSRGVTVNKVVDDIIDSVPIP